MFSNYKQILQDKRKRAVNTNLAVSGLSVERVCSVVAETNDDPRTKNVERESGGQGADLLVSADSDEDIAVSLKSKRLEPRRAPSSRLSRCKYRILN